MKLVSFIYEEVQNASPFYLLVLCFNFTYMQFFWKSGLYFQPCPVRMHRNSVSCSWWEEHCFGLQNC